MAFMSAFQAEDGGSIPPTRSKEKMLLIGSIFSFIYPITTNKKDAALLASLNNLLTTTEAFC